MTHAKKILFIGNPTGHTYDHWYEWAVRNAHEFIQVALHELPPWENETPIVVVDTFGLNDMPMPKLYGKEPSMVIVDELWMGPAEVGRIIHENIDKHLIIEHKPTYEFRVRATPNKVVSTTTRRSKGDRKRNKRDRWT